MKVGQSAGHKRATAKSQNSYGVFSAFDNSTKSQMLILAYLGDRREEVVSANKILDES